MFFKLAPRAVLIRAGLERKEVSRDPLGRAETRAVTAEPETDGLQLHSGREPMRTGHGLNTGDSGFWLEQMELMIALHSGMMEALGSPPQDVTLTILECLKFSENKRATHSLRVCVYIG